jgi:hypothetical protein
MRIFFGHFGASLAAALVAVAWIVLFGDATHSILRSFRVPDLVGAWLPAVAVGWRQIAEYQAGCGQPLSALLELVAGVPMFLVFDLPARLLFGAIDGAWRGEEEWEKVKPIWAAMIYGTMAIIVVLGCRRFGIPPFDRILVPYHVLVGAATLAGLVIGFGSYLRAMGEKR